MSEARQTHSKGGELKPAVAGELPKPRPKLLLVLAIVYFFWLAFLLTMYFVTVYPTRAGA